MVNQVSIAQRHHFISYSVKEGLAQSQVRDILQSHDGHLWIATIGGVSRFDGINFKNYSKSNGLLNNVITSIHETSDHEILIACQGGIVKIANEKLQQFPFPEEFKEVIVFDMIEHNGLMMLASNGHGLLNWSNGEIEQLPFSNKDEGFIRALEKANDDVLIGTKNGLIIKTKSKEKHVLKNISINEIAVYKEEIWVASTQDGIFRLSPEDTMQLTVEDGLTSLYQKDICIDREGNPWFISKNGIIKYDRSNGKCEVIRSIVPTKVDNLKVIFCDRESNIWIGTSGSGILKYTGNFSETFSVLDGLASDQIMNIKKDNDGTFWFATYGAGVISMKNEELRTINFEKGLMNNTVWSLEIMRNNEIWIGTSDGINIYKTDGVLSEFVYNEKLPFVRVSAIFQDHAGNIWIGTRDGILCVHEDEIITPKSLVDLDLSEVKSFCQTGDKIWMSTRYGVYAYNLSNRNVEHYLKDTYCSSLTKDMDNNIWVGTDEGVIKISTKSKLTKLFYLSTKPSSNIINFLTHDSLNSLWVGTDNGLFSINTELLNNTDSFMVRSFNEHDGIVSQESNQNAAFCDNQGDLWFGMNGALIKINPRKIPDNSNVESTVTLNDLQLNFESIEANNYTQKGDSFPKFKFNENRFTFKYSAIHFGNPDKVSYSYQLIGSDLSWSPSVKENSVTYANLSPGEYEFKVRVKLENTAWGEPVSLFRFTIAPPFYNTWWFILLLTLTGLGVLWSISRLISNQRRRKRKLFELQNRAKILGLEQQTLNAHMNRHFIFNALNSIQYYINTQDKRMANRYLSSFATLVRKNLDSAQVDAISLKDELDRLELYLNLEQMRFQNRFDYAIDLESGVDSENLMVPSMILQPFVENSIMHGILPSLSKGKISIHIGLHQADLIITIKDNGIGFNTSVSQKNGTSIHVSNGMKITRQRMEVLRAMTKDNYQINGPEEIISASGGSDGTVVVITIPKKYSQDIF